MIYDRIENLPILAERIPVLRTALLAAHKQILAPFAEGTVEYDERRCYAASSIYQTAPRETKQFENHRRYLDVQMLAAGEEQIDVFIPTEPLSANYSIERDIEFSPIAMHCTTVTLRPGEFLLLLPGEWHRPGIAVGKEAAECRKIVVKSEYVS